MTQLQPFSTVPVTSPDRSKEGDDRINEKNDVGFAIIKGVTHYYKDE